MKSFSIPALKKDEITLGKVTIKVPLCKLPDGSSYFHYFKLNDQPELIEEGAKLIAERINASGAANPYFVTPEASTLALAHVLRTKYNIDGLTIYKNPQINETELFSISYDTVTSSKPKMLYLDKAKANQLENKSLFIIDSVCTTGGTIKAVYQLLKAAGIKPSSIIEATMLFNEGTAKNSINTEDKTTLPLHSFSYLPIVPIEPSLTKHSLFAASSKLEFVIASQSQIKIAAAHAALKQIYKSYELVALETKSNVNEQPLEAETELGANNRLTHAIQLAPNADGYIAVENGIFADNGRYFDKAIIKIKLKNQDIMRMESEAVEFPQAFVEQARKIGFDKTTVAACMAAAGVIKNSKDPHAELGSKKTREELLTSAIVDCLNGVRSDIQYWLPARYK